MRTSVRRTAVVAALASAALAFAAVPAWAHVTVDAPGATKGGGDQIINVRVPNESDTASTVGLELQLPTDTPIASILVQPTPGWTFAETSVTLPKPIVTDDGTITKAVSELDWTAAPGQGINPREFQQFVLIAGQLPDAPSVTFKAIQTYSDGRVVSWTDVAAPGSKAELGHPAPVLTLPQSIDNTSKSKASDTGPIVLSIVALVVAAAALGLAFVGRARRRTPS